MLKMEYSGREYVWRVEFGDALVRGVDVGWDIGLGRIQERAKLRTPETREKRLNEPRWGVRCPRTQISSWGTMRCVFALPPLEIGALEVAWFSSVTRHPHIPEDNVDREVHLSSYILQLFWSRSQHKRVISRAPASIKHVSTSGL